MNLDVINVIARDEEERRILHRVRLLNQQRQRSSSEGSASMRLKQSTECDDSEPVKEQPVDHPNEIPR
jgi:hypothetical protein